MKLYWHLYKVNNSKINLQKTEIFLLTITKINDIIYTK